MRTTFPVSRSHSASARSSKSSYLTTPRRATSPFSFSKRKTSQISSKKRFVALTAKNNVYKAWGSYLKDPVYQWAKETNAKALQLNQHVSYIHSKFLLKDPLST